jgi:hypothetical protein
MHRAPFRATLKAEQLGRSPGRVPPAMVRTLHQLFTYYAQAEAFEAEEAWRLLGEPQLRWADFVAGYPR